MQIYNTLTKKKEAFKPLNPPKVTIYVCGLTVYDYCHIGNARVSIVFDVLIRHLTALGHKVTYVHNITDIDDKIIKRAGELQITTQELTERFTIAMHEDEKQLQNLSPTFEPRASQHIPEIINLIVGLVTKGFAYTTDSGDVYYSVEHFLQYGEFANQNLNNLRAGARVEVSEAKRDPLDFVLWKKAKPGEPAWPSPWGDGRPGWHSECAVMATKYLGEYFDIHGGGADLKFPHHQNEIAQAEAYFGHKIVNTWMHVGFVEVNKEKMSKSLGNFFTLREVLKLYHPEVVRLFILASHYRSPLDYATENLDSAKLALQRLYTALSSLPVVNLDPKTISASPFYKNFMAAMNDDLNTPMALAQLFNLARDINKLREQGKLKEAIKQGAVLRALGSNFLGILQHSPDEFLFTTPIKDNIDIAKITALIKERELARQNKDWAQADVLRKQLKDLHVELEDTMQGTTWKII